MNGTATPAGEIITIAVPRSGTNFMCECIADLPGVLGLFEIFNPRGVFGARNAGLLDALNDELGTNHEDVSDPELVELFRSQPLVAVEHLRRATAARGFSHVSYKVFPGQIGDRELSQLLDNRSGRVLVLTRRRLDVYISYVKARELDVWKSDIIIASKDMSSHMDTLQKVLKRLQEVGLKLKLTKCNFLSPKIKFLGHEVDEKGIHTVDDKIAAVTKFPQDIIHYNV